MSRTEIWNSCCTVWFFVVPGSAQYAEISVQLFRRWEASSKNNANTTECVGSSESKYVVFLICLHLLSDCFFGCRCFTCHWIERLEVWIIFLEILKTSATGKQLLLHILTNQKTTLLLGNFIFWGCLKVFSIQILVFSCFEDGKHLQKIMQTLPL